MAISQEAKIIANRIYVAYGSDSGYLFGISPDKKPFVQAIVQATIDILKKK